MVSNKTYSDLLDDTRKQNVERYERAIDWIACNDGVLLTDRDDIADLLTVCLVAETFKMSPDHVAIDVMAARVRAISVAS